MRKSFLTSFALAGVSAAVTALSSGTASAGPVTATYQGFVSGGYDQFGVFGAANIDLTGDAFTTVYTINDAALGATTYSDSNVSYIYGGVGFGSLAPAVSAVVTINGHSLSIAGNYEGEAYQSTSASDYLVDHFANSAIAPGTNAEAQNYVLSVSDPFTTSGDYHTPLFHQVQPGDSSFGEVLVYNESTGYSLDVALTNTSVSISGLTEVPEPASWAMMIFGLGCVGVQLRRRTTNVALTA
jgi:hypothetical protein